MKRQGVSLLEMLLVMAFIAIGFLSILQLLVANLAAESVIENSYVAMNIASGKMEQLINAPYSSIVSETTVEVTDFPGFYQSVNVASVEASLKQIKIRVSWQDDAYILDTLKSNYP